MKDCPECGRVNEENASVCIQCGKEFPTESKVVDPSLEDPAEALVVVAKFANLADANLLKTRLEAEGIEVEVPEEFTPQFPFEHVTVRVAAKDLEAAEKIVADSGTP